MPEAVTLYFDVISPYAWLGLKAAEPFGRAHDLEWRLRPVVYGALLDATGLVGPAEIESKRRYTFFDIGRLAAREGYAFQGPPAHPFRSLEALRTICLFLDRPETLPLAVALADAAWAEGRDLTDPAVIADVVAGRGLDAEGLPGRLADPQIKQRLQTHTAEALEAGVFGVPTFAWRGELFWGHDRLELLAGRLTGTIPDTSERARQFLSRPRGIDRKGSPGR